MISRRDLLRAMALGGGIVAGELWVPGARVFSIPQRGPEPVYAGMDLAEALAQSMCQTREAAFARVLGQEFRRIYFLSYGQLDNARTVRMQEIENGRVLVEQQIPIEEIYSCKSPDAAS